MLKKILLVCFFLYSILGFAQNHAEIGQVLKKNQNQDTINAIAEEAGYKPGDEIRVITVFKVDKNGEVSDVKASGPEKTFEEEAKRLIKSLPKLEGQNFINNEIGQNFALPLIFKVESKKEQRKRLKRKRPKF